MPIRVTTNGMFKAYRTDLIQGNKKLRESMERVSTHRNFSSYSEAPADASRAFKLRRTLWRMDDQITNMEYLINKNELAYTSVAAIVDGTSESPGLDGFVSTLRGMTDSIGAGRTSLASDLLSKSESIVSIMNTTFSGESIFAGADGKNVPFAWDGDTLYYRGADLSADPESEDYAKLEAMSAEATYVDIGLGMSEELDENGDPRILADSAYDSSIFGADILGWGQDEDGDSLCLPVLMRELGRIFERCDSSSGAYASNADRDRAWVLTEKLEYAIMHTQEEHVSISADTDFLKSSLQQMQDDSFTMDQQLEDLEQEDPALAITEMMWAQYCYQAALRIGQDILSETLFNYID